MARSGVDVGLLFGTRIARLFAYGFVSVVLVLYLSTAGFGTSQSGLLLTLTLVGDAVNGRLTYRPQTNRAPDCGVLDACSTVQSFSGSRPPQ